MKTPFSRRSILQAGAAVAGASAGSGLLGGRRARAQSAEKNALVMIYFLEGYNAIFSSADSFLSKGSFGVTSDNTREVQGGFRVDLRTLGSLPEGALQKMAAVGVAHGISQHGPAQHANLTLGARSYPLALAHAMGGDAAIKCAKVGRPEPRTLVRTPESGVTLQDVLDMNSANMVLGVTGARHDETEPGRAFTARGLLAAERQSAGHLDLSPDSLGSLREAYPAAFATLTRPRQELDFPELQSAYGVSGTAVNSWASQLAAAELMVRAGANVVTVFSPEWDYHGDKLGTEVRERMEQQILPALRTFVGRSLALPGFNVVTTLLGDFSRSLPGSDHQENLTATVLGRRVKPGTTGRVDATVRLPPGTPGIQGYWAYLAALVACPAQPFGPNPHPSLLL